MNGHEKRAIEKENHIKRSALELFKKYGVAKVSIDEIANFSNVSKVTIYKYFGSKTGLFKEIVRMMLDETLDEIQSVLSSELSFIEKLKFIISTKVNYSTYMNGSFIQEFISLDREVGEFIKTNYKKPIEDIMFSFFDMGKKEGYINSDIPNKTIILYVEIFRAGLSQKSFELGALNEGNQIYQDLINLYFYGIIKSD